MATIKQKLEEAAIELAEAKARLKTAQEGWDQLYRQAVGGSKSKKQNLSAGVSDGAKQPISTLATDRIEGVLLSDSNKEWNYEEIEKALPDIPKSSIRALLFKLKKGGKAIKVGRGLWKSTQPRLVNFN